MRIHEANCPEQLRDWCAGSRARLLLQRENVLLRDILGALTGFRLLQVGSWGLGSSVLDNAATLYQWRLASEPQRYGDIGFDGVNFPIASASIDALLLAHTLDLASDPYQLLRECDRVLNDSGQLVVLGFNPLSLWALAQRLPGRGTTAFVHGARFYTAHRVCDWLRLLGIEPEQIIRYGVGFPFLSRGVSVPTDQGRHRRVAAARVAQAYLIVARKRVTPLTPKRWRPLAGARKASARIGLANHGAGRLNSRR